MQFVKWILLTALMLPVAIHAEEKPTTAPKQFNNPVFTQEALADPFCFYHEGTYYTIATGGTGSDGRAVPMVKSKDLQHWESVGRVLIPAPEDAKGNIWAPEIAYDNGTFYLYYHADGNGKGFHIRVAKSKNPEGPYRDTNAPLTDVTKNPFAIDSHQFRDDDGQWYIFYATDFKDITDTTFRGTALVVDRMTSMTQLAGNPQPVMRAHWQWQVYERNRTMYGTQADWYTLEGPNIKKRDGKYYCFYSGGNYQNDSYGVDYLVADNILGPWKEVGKERGPQIMRSIPGKVIGPGHNSVVTTPEGQDYIVYHAWTLDKKVGRLMNISPILWTPDGPRVERFAERIKECNAKAEAEKVGEISLLPVELYAK